MADAADPGREAAALATMQLLLALRQAGIRDQALLRTIETVPRQPFLPHLSAAAASSDIVAPLACGQMTTRPALVGRMLEALQVGGGHGVLEIGTGSGWPTAVVARRAATVVTLDRWRGLTQAAKALFATLGLGNIETRTADGFKGDQRGGKFDRIIAYGAVPTLPDCWGEQLLPGGRLVVAIGAPGARQAVTLVTKTRDGIGREMLFEARLPMLVEGVSERL